MKRVCLIGSGNVAEALVYALAGEKCASPETEDRRNDTPVEDYRLIQILARNRARGLQLAEAAGCEYTDAPARLARADIYLIAVSDTQIGQVAAGLDFGDAVVAHTAGSVSFRELPSTIANRGVFYPLQTFTAGRRIDFGQVPLLIEGENALTTATLHALARKLSNSVHEVSERQRAQLHLSAVFACNFTNHMYAIAQQLLAAQQLPAGVLNPLIEETTAKALDSPSAAVVQTGPARRGDLTTQQKHLELLAGEEALQNLYKNISLHIWETSKKT